MVHWLMLFLSLVVFEGFFGLISFLLSLMHKRCLRIMVPSARTSITHSQSDDGSSNSSSHSSSRLNSMKELFDRTGKCGLCEARLEDVLINESAHFFSVIPFATSFPSFATSFPFEIWIVPRDHTSYFHDIDEEKVMYLFFFNFIRYTILRCLLIDDICLLFPLALRQTLVLIHDQITQIVGKRMSMPRAPIGHAQ